MRSATIFASTISLFTMVACSSSSGDGGTTGDPTPISSNDGGGATGSDGGDDGDGGTKTTGPTRCASPPCTDGAACAVGTSDCTSGVCTSGVCQAPTHGDHVKNGDETGIDCGGPSSNTPCADGQGCANDQATRDCTSKVCTNAICQVPTDSDTVKNGTETDIDCGGATAKACLAGKTCAANTDCSSRGCNTVSKTCAWGRSCTSHHGNDTCGIGDETFTQAAGATMSSGTKDHHDCCESAIVDPDGTPGNTDDFRLDTYQITAGRMRRFIEATGGNVRGWVQNARGNLAGETFKDPKAKDQLPTTFDKYLPLTMLGTETAPTVPPNDGSFEVIDATSPVNVVAHLGGYRFTTEPGGTGGYGCVIANDNYGARTYRLDTQAQLNLAHEKQHAVSQERLDEKVLTCVDYYMLAAFCAWDGGRLETKTEHDIAWGPHARPWGDDTGTQGFDDAVSSTRYRGADNNTLDNIEDRTKTSLGNFNITWLERVNGGWNYSNYIIQDRQRFLYDRETVRTYPGESDQFFIAAHGAPQTWDQTYGVAPPGRYPSGAGPWGHQDLLGNVIEITAEAVPAGSGISYRWTKNGSFEEYVHWNGQNPFDTGYDGFQFAGMAKYGRSGGRCARPIAHP